MFRVDSRIAGDILGISPETHMLLVVFEVVHRNTEDPGGEGALPLEGGEVGHYHRRGHPRHLSRNLSPAAFQNAEKDG